LGDREYYIYGRGRVSRDDDKRRIRDGFLKERENKNKKKIKPKVSFLSPPAG